MLFAVVELELGLKVADIGEGVLVLAVEKVIMLFTLFLLVGCWARKCDIAIVE